MRKLTVILVSITTFSLAQINNTNQTPLIPEKGAVNINSLNDKQRSYGEIKEILSEGLNEQDGPKQKQFSINKKAVVNFENITKDFYPSLMVIEKPKQGAKKMEIYNYPEKRQAQSSNTNTVLLQDLIKGQSFFGNPFGVNTPNDNDMAISDSGMVISVINTNIFVRNTVTNISSPVKSLAAFTTPVNSRHQEFDPKVMYDPKLDKFVLVCLVGFVDTTSQIIVGFSQTNNPAGNWNLYTLPGNPLNNNLWSDYPMIAMTENELFLSVNLLYNDSSWQTGFVETVVWQLDKRKGYAGSTLTSNLHSNIKFNGKAIRNLCPAKGGSKLYSPNMYFVSNRNLASQNDTVFLVNVTDTIGSSTNTVTTKALVTNQPYYFPPNGRQSIASQSLATNDCRNLGAFYENNKIQFVYNTNNPVNNQVSVGYGIINNPQNLNPQVSGYIIPNDTMDFAYPNISYAGKSNSDDTCIINFNHSSNTVFAGCSAIRADASGNFSPVLRIQNGANYINLLQSNLERWGDYSGSQRKYNRPGEVWISGYYSYLYNSGFPKAHGAWIAQIFTDTIPEIKVDTTQYASVPSINNTNQIQSNVYPNPAHGFFMLEVSLEKPEYLTFELEDVNGKQLEVLLRDWVKGKQNLFSFNTANLSAGVFFLKVKGNYGTSVVKKIIIN